MLPLPAGVEVVRENQYQLLPGEPWRTFFTMIDLHNETWTDSDGPTREIAWDNGIEKLRGSIAELVPPLPFAVRAQVHLKKIQVPRQPLRQGLSWAL